MSFREEFIDILFGVEGNRWIRSFYLLICLSGGFFYTYRGIGPFSLKGVIDSMLIRQGVNVITLSFSFLIFCVFCFMVWYSIKEITYRILQFCYQTKKYYFYFSLSLTLIALILIFGFAFIQTAYKYELPLEIVETLQKDIGRVEFKCDSLWSRKYLSEGEVLICSSKLSLNEGYRFYDKKESFLLIYTNILDDSTPHNSSFVIKDNLKEANIKEIMLAPLDVGEKEILFKILTPIVYPDGSIFDITLHKLARTFVPSREEFTQRTNSKVTFMLFLVTFTFFSCWVGVKNLRDIMERDR